jgi:hypothetical protein
MGSSERYHKFHATKHPPQQAFLLDQFSDNDIRKWQRNFFSILSAKCEGVVYNFQPFA